MKPANQILTYDLTDSYSARSYLIATVWLKPSGFKRYKQVIVNILQEVVSIQIFAFPDQTEQF